MIINILSFLIRLYQKIKHSLFTGTCRFHPSCSEYALEALQKYGAVKGSIKAICRILRCSPLSRGGFDPLT
ncbi:MAG: membrane protein insertion efficiency factor YidD [Candidatus Omnitrophica bacterium]|nr:membrane protein insertion efficiency factor YidD [Candidatus Omnitrophota bacterium]